MIKFFRADMDEGANPLELAFSHRWDLPVKEAKALQGQLAERLVTETTFDLAAVETVAGVDVGFRGGLARAAVVVLSFPDLVPVDSALFEEAVSFAYVPGLLAFREGPPVLGALEKLTTWPDLCIYDAHGLSHPRRMGLASHMGVILDQPSIGCAKSRLIGMHSEPGDGVGDWTPLRDQDEIIGAVVRSRSGVRPLYVSIGHRVDLSTSIGIVLRCTRGYRLPETTRLAHQLAGGAELPIRRS
jgi:deoxyribonuclease V